MMVPVREKFTGKEFDQEGGNDGIGLYNFEARLYDPDIGIFAGADPLEEYFNVYSYTGQNPVNFIDPTGLHSDGLEHPYPEFIFTEPPETENDYQITEPERGAGTGIEGEFQLTTPDHTNIEIYSPDVQYTESPRLDNGSPIPGGPEVTIGEKTGNALAAGIAECGGKLLNSMFKVNNNNGKKQEGFSVSVASGVNSCASSGGISNRNSVYDYFGNVFSNFSKDLNNFSAAAGVTGTAALITTGPKNQFTKIAYGISLSTYIGSYESGMASDFFLGKTNKNWGKRTAMFLPMLMLNLSGSGAVSEELLKGTAGAILDPVGGKLLK